MIEIWCEGDPKLDFTACHLGTVKADTLLEACLELATRNPYFSRYLIVSNLTYKGCKLFDNYEDAVASYG